MQKEADSHSTITCADVHHIAPEHADNVIIVAFANVIDKTVPPMIIICNGTNRKPSFDDELMPLTTFEMVLKGSMTNEAAIKWLHHLEKCKQL